MCSSDPGVTGMGPRGARGPAVGNRGGSSGAPGVPPRVTGVGPRGRPGSHQGSPRWVFEALKLLRWN